MNNLFSKYSKKFMGLAMASLVFTACEKDEFTEQEALDLELKRLQEQERIAKEKDQLNHKQLQDLKKYQRTLDSLDKVNAGGLVYYSVIPVSAAEAVFSKGGPNGRTEKVQGIEGATVSIAQYGRVLTATKDENKPGTVVTDKDPNLAGPGVANGIYTFPMLRSGEVGVTIKAANHSTVNYVANLTPDGAVANGQVTYVSNVIPLFNIAEADKMATIKGKAWVETDLTNGVEEQVPNGTTIKGTIDVEDPDFWNRYFRESSDEGQGYGSNKNTYVTGSGYVQRYAYELPTNSSAGSMLTSVNNGQYSLLVPSSSVGLPISLEFSEFLTDRTFYRDNKVVKTRHAYGPKVKSDAIENGVDNVKLRFNIVQSEAALKVAYKPAKVLDRLGFVTVSNASSTWYNKGYFKNDPTFTVNGTGAKVGIGVKSTVKATSNFDFGLGLSRIETLKVLSEGSGFAGRPAVSVQLSNRTDVTEIGTVAAGATGTGAGVSFLGIGILNGGNGFNPNFANKAGTSVKGVFTNYPPTVTFSKPAVGGTRATAIPVIDTRLGVIVDIEVTNSGAGYAKVPTISLTYGESATIADAQGQLGQILKPLLLVDKDTKSLTFNTSLPNTFLSIQANRLTFTSGLGSGYAFVPDVTIGGLPNGSTVADNIKFSVTVGTDVTKRTFGKITSISILQGTVNSSLDFQTITNTKLGYFMSVAFPNNQPAIDPLNLSVVPETDQRGFRAIVSSSSGLGAAGGVGTYSVTQPIQQFPGLGQSGIDLTAVSKQVGTPFTSIELAYATAGSPTLAQVDFASVPAAIYSLAKLTDKTQTDAVKLRFLSVAEYLVVTDNPTKDAMHAWGVIVKQGNSHFVHFLEHGTGYNSTLQKMYVVPNLYKDAGSLTSLSNLKSVANSKGEKYWPKDNDIYAYFRDNTSHHHVNGKYLAGLKQEAATLSLSVTNGGSGYLATPKLVFFGEGVKIDDELIGDANSLAKAVKIDSKGSLYIDRNAALANGLEYSATSKTASLVGTAISHKSYPTEIANLKAVAIDKVADELNDQWVKMISASKVSGTSKVFGIDSEGSIFLNMKQPVKYNNMTKYAWEWLSLEKNTFTGAAIGTEDGVYYSSKLPLKIAISAPASTSGKQATASASIVLVNNTTKARRIKLVLTEKGSGYARGNYYYNDGKGAATDGSTPDNGDSRPTSNGTTASQDFRIIGGETGKAGDMKFDTFTGITYARDVHYGTGKEVE